MNRKVNRCKSGDIVISGGKKVMVNDVICEGREGGKGSRAHISVFQIMPDNGQILRRSSKCVGAHWHHL